MSVKKWLAERGIKASDKIAQLSSLSPEQLSEVTEKRADYFAQLIQNSPNDPALKEMTEFLIASGSIEVFNSHLPELSSLYLPVQKDNFDSNHNIRYFNITKWVTDKEENSLEKLVNVYGVLSNENCNIALIFNRLCDRTEVYLAVTNNKNSDSNKDADDYCQRLKSALKGNFPGVEFSNEKKSGIPEFLDNDYRYSVASCSNIPAEKSEKFLSQTVEKLLDGIVPERKKQEYVLILLATPVQDAEQRKLRLAELYSGLAPYASWQTNFTYSESDSVNSSASLGVNVGASAGVQNGQNQSVGTSDSVSRNSSDSSSQTESRNNSVSEGRTHSTSDSRSQGTSTSQSTNHSFTGTESSTNTNSFGVNSSDTRTSGTGFSHSDSINTSTTSTTGTSNSVNNSISGTVGVSRSISVSGGISAGPFSASASETVGVNASVTAQHGTSSSWSNSLADTSGTTATDSASSNSSTAHQIGRSFTSALARGISQSIQDGTSLSEGQTLTNTLTDGVSRALQNTVARGTAKQLTQTLGKAVSNTVNRTAGTFASVNLGTNFGVNFARASNITATVGKNEGITQNFTNFNIKYALEKLEEQMKRYEQSTALGMWDFSAYVMSEDQNTVTNVAHSYLALTQGEKSHLSTASVNVWRGDTVNSDDAVEICSYLRELRHPVFALDPIITEFQPDLNTYPPIVTASTALSGKELAYSLNFPKKSVAGFPVIECAEFGRNITSYTDSEQGEKTFNIGNVFHMNHAEKTPVEFSADSLASHTFVTGSTGTGKSNAVYQIINEAMDNEVNFLVIEPAKGEYKHVFGTIEDVSVYGTNPAKTPLLRINPFSFPKGIHVLEHLDRLTEIFNACWPMYAAMPAVLKRAVELSYSDCGWNLTESSNAYGNGIYPDFSDVARNIKNVIDNSEYDAENKGAYKGSLLTRLNSLSCGINGMIFNSDEISNSKLFDEDVIVDLSRVGSGETKSLIMGMLIMKLQEYRMVSEEMNMPLKHITVLEEAHNILRRTNENESLRGRSVEMISNAIAEMRTYGEGFVIVDQSPSLLDMSAIRNTNTKIILRLPDKDDRELAGKSANLNESQINELARLPRGVGAVYQNEWIQPVLCKFRKARGTNRRYENTCEFKAPLNRRYALEIAELLASCEKLDHKTVLYSIKPKLMEMNINSSVCVKIYRLLENPPKNLSFEKTAPIISELFPQVLSAVRLSCSLSENPKDWTRSAEDALSETSQADDTMRIFIVTSIMTDYIKNEVGKEELLEKWSEEGDLR